MRRQHKVPKTRTSFQSGGRAKSSGFVFNNHTSTIDRMNWRLNLDRGVDNRVRPAMHWPAGVGGGRGWFCF